MKGSRSINDLSMFASANGDASGRSSPQHNQSFGGSSNAPSAYTTLPRQHRVPENHERGNDRSNKTVSSGNAGGGQQDAASLRRACSLSDLSKGGGGPQRRILPSTPGSGKLELFSPQYFFSSVMSINVT